MIDTTSLASAAARRSILYWTFAELFLTCPDAGFVERLGEALRPGALSGSSARLTKHLRAMRRALPRDASGVENLAVEYTRAFGAVSPSYGLPAPYESVHRQSDSAAELQAAVGRFYLEAGLVPVDAAVPADHLGSELKFLSFLCHKESEAWRTGKENALRLQRQQWSFLDAHLMRWAPEYLAMLRTRSRHALYRGAALLALETLTEHSESLRSEGTCREQKLGLPLAPA